MSLATPLSAFTATRLLVFAAACCTEEKPPPPAKPEAHAGLEDLQIAPAAGAAGQKRTRKVQLHGWYRGDSNNVVSGPGTLTWGLQLNGGTTRPDGEVTVSSFPNNGSRTGEAQVGDGTSSDTVKMILWANAEAAKAGGDVVEVTEPPTVSTTSALGVVDPPVLALLESRSSNRCQWTRPLPFIGALSVGEQDAIPCSLALFSSRYGMLFQEKITDTKWTQKGAHFSVTRPETLLVRITVFLAVTQPAAAQGANVPAEERAPDPAELARLDVQRANLIYETNNTGIRVDAEYRQMPLTSDLPIRVGADPYDCMLAFNLPSNSAKPDYGYNPSRVSVYYVDRINYPLDPVQPRVRGIQCHHWYSGNPDVGSPPGRGPVVFISYSHHSPVTLAHELGHVLGLNDEAGRLGNRNVMHNLLPDGPLGADARSHLTVGQAFRMNLWDDSWINSRKPPPLVVQRACDARQPCPAIWMSPDVY